MGRTQIDISDFSKPFLNDGFNESSFSTKNDFKFPPFPNSQRDSMIIASNNSSLEVVSNLRKTSNKFLNFSVDLRKMKNQVK